MTTLIKSYAKINLFLHIIDRLENGYHDLDTIISRINLYDEIKIQDGNNFSVRYEGKFSPMINVNDNVTLLFNYLIEKELIKNKNYNITVIKNIPVGSGLGGGSSNIAAILNYLKKTNILCDSQCIHVARALGSDIEFFLEDEPAKIHGRGIVETRIKILSDMYFLIVYPNILLSTKKIFSKNKKYRAQKFDYNEQMTLKNILLYTANDLEDSALSDQTEIQSVKNFFQNDQNCQFSRMTGSGSAFFGCYQSRRDLEEAISILNNEQPSWWAYKVELI